MQRGKVLWEKDIEELKGNWGRYLDKDGDAITYRTVPGNRNPMSSYFARGTGHDEYARYTEDSSMWLKNMDRLKRKYETARKFVPAPVLYERPGATVGVIGFGSTEAAILEAIHQLDSEHGVKADFLRVRAIPFTQEVTDFIHKHDRIFVVEQNRDGQLHQLLIVAYPEQAANLKSVAYGDGLPASAKWVREGVLAKQTVPAMIDAK
jgi:2-oxoglutarate ferredoxin oxidoreductase subunit alpha